MKSRGTNRCTGFAQTAGIIAVLLAVVALAPRAAADERRREYGAEFDAFHDFTNGTRLFLLADTGKEEGKSSWENQVGVHLDISSKHARRPRVHLADWARERTLGLRVGYRQLRLWEDERKDVHERRGLAELTFRSDLPYGVSMANRLGYDYRDIRGRSSQRYRYRLNLERKWTAGSVLLVPYVQAEFVYDTRYASWNREHYQLGTEIALTKHWRLEPYLATDRDAEPVTRYTDQIGLVAKFYW